MDDANFTQKVLWPGQEERADFSGAKRSRNHPGRREGVKISCRGPNSNQEKRMSGALLGPGRAKRGPISIQLHYGRDGVSRVTGKKLGGIGH